MTHFVLLPFAIFWFILSERMKMIHQSRVGSSQYFSGYVLQQLANLKAELGKPPTFLGLIQYTVQLSLIFSVVLSDQPGLFFLVLVFNLFVSTIKRILAVEKTEIRTQRELERALIGSTLAFASSYVAISIQGSWNFDVLNSQWTILSSPLSILGMVGFLVSGMVLFEEHPFQILDLRNSKERSTIEAPAISSLRYYVWCLVACVLFLGGDDGFGALMLYLKATVLYLVSRQIGLYFPRYNKEILNKVHFHYLVPMVLLVMAITWIISGLWMISGGGLSD